MNELPERVRAVVDRRAGPIVAALVALGVLLLAANGPFSSVRSLRLVQFVDRALVAAVAAVAYVRARSTPPSWDAVAVAAWVFLAVPVAGTLGYFAFGGGPGSYPGPMGELVNDVLRFLLSVAAVGGLCAAAGAALRRDRRAAAALALLAVPVGQFLVYGAVVLAGA
ncbi:hypothetical protein [Halostella litorea]|uniref:hypothetical protein n=1 Tax=Halostella litorea TaxID=2528831 RepID=UPI001092B05E|nr:hypothetical protein [Halostella litorea]